MRGELKRLQHELGTTALYVTHDQAEAMTLAHRVAVMRNGRLQQLDTPMNIYHRPANRFVAEFVGSPAMNFIEGRVDESARLFLGREVALHLAQSQLELIRGRERVTLGIRPEHIELAETATGEEWLPVVVYVTEQMGNETLVFLRLGDEKIIARARADFRAEPETPIRAKFLMERADFFDAESGEALR
jgi:multiple sugar transport system ATP-binding protein